MDDEAVSPVVGTILMVAIVVVLAATAFVVFQVFLGDEDLEPVRVVGEADDRRDQWQLVRSNPVQQAEIQWRGDDGVRYSDSGPATAASPLVPTSWTPLGGNEAWTAGSTLSFCADGLTPALEWSFELQETRQDATYIGRFTYSVISVCL